MLRALTLTRAGLAQQFGGVGTVQQGFLHVQPRKPRTAAFGRGIAHQLRRHLVRHGRAGAGVDQRRFRGDSLGIDDLMRVKEQLEIIDKSAVLPDHGVAVDQMTRLDQQLGPACAQLVRALIDEQAVVGADHQIVEVVQRA